MRLVSFRLVGVSHFPVCAGVDGTLVYVSCLRDAQQENFFTLPAPFLIIEKNVYAPMPFVNRRNEKKASSTRWKIARMVDIGVRAIEIDLFVHPEAVPAMAGTVEEGADGARCGRRR
jgi:hypothetical protein